jgi:hypothetical protein
MRVSYSVIVENIVRETCCNIVVLEGYILSWNVDKLQCLVYSSDIHVICIAEHFMFFWDEVVANGYFSRSKVKEMEPYCVSFTVVLSCIVLYCS